VEFKIESGHIQIRTDEGNSVPAYWAHPDIGQDFSGICLLHDWWGTTDVVRMLSNFFAQMGYYVVAPDLFDGAQAHTPTQAMQLLEKTESTRYNIVSAALDALETHNHVNHSVAVLGLGMGGSLAYEAAVTREDIEAAVSYAGFPQRYLGRFKQAQTPTLAVYGSDEPYTRPVVIKALRDELAESHLAADHRIVIVPEAGHEFFSSTPDPKMRPISKRVINETLAFLERHLEQPVHQKRTRY
jgi:carboxymethylenebutenolidase